MSGIGAYRKRDDHEVVFVFARASAPGGRFSALRVGGRWKPAEFTFGDLEDDFLPIPSHGEVMALVKAARAKLIWQMPGSRLKPSIARNRQCPKTGRDQTIAACRTNTDATGDIRNSELPASRGKLSAANEIGEAMSNPSEMR